MEKFKAKLQNLKGVIAKHKKQTAIISIVDSSNRVSSYFNLSKR